MTELSTNSIRILDIKYGTSVDGIGLRTSLYCAGCENHCVGCHNPQSWDENGGEVIEIEELFRLIVDADMNVTFTGGDPMFHPEGFIQLAQMIKEQTDKTIWCYTGYTWERLMAEGDVHVMTLLQNIDVLVDGPFVQSLRNTDLLFRGSSNQRLIDVQKSLATGGAVEWHR